MGTAVAGNVLSGAALGLGSVALVQPLLVSRLLFALPLSALWMQQRLGRRDWLGMVATAGGLAVFVAVGHPRPGSAAHVASWRWLVAGVLLGGIVLALVLLGRRFGPALQAPMLGAGAGMLFGLQSGLTQTAVHHLIGGGVLALLTTWPTYGVVVAAVLGTLLAQSAYEMAPLAASYPALAAVEPLTGIGVGVGVLGAALTVSRLFLGIEVLGLACMTGGIYLLATSPLVSGQSDAMRQRQEEEQAYHAQEQVQRELGRLERDVRRLESAAPEAGRAAELPRIGQRLERVEAELERLSIMKRDILAGEGEEEEAAAEPRLSRVTSQVRHQRAMRQWAEQIDSRERELRDSAAQLHSRIGQLNTPWRNLPGYVLAVV